MVKKEMKKGLLLSLLIVFSCFIITGCFKKSDIKEENIEEENTVVIKIDNQEYKLLLEENETVKSLRSLLPLELTMQELNENEKYVYLEKNLPVDSHCPKKINKGDVMLYGNNCLVIFYKTFNTNYSYTKIGRIENLEEIGPDSIKVQIEKTNR